MRTVTPARWLALALLGLGAAACQDRIAEAPGVMGRDAFVDTYVDLRTTAVTSEDGVLDEAERAEVLVRHGVTEAELVEFARVYGADAEYMRGVWDEIEDRLDEPPPAREEGGR